MSRRFNHRPLGEAERDARRQADRERVEQSARALLASDGWQRWIRVRATNGLSRYSLRNQWPIAIECHARGITPTYVAGFRAFLALNRCVHQGEKAIRILAPVAVKQRRRTAPATRPACAESRAPRARFRPSARARVTVGGAPARDELRASRIGIGSRSLTWALRKRGRRRGLRLLVA
jgi:hypothetical protein